MNLHDIQPPEHIWIFSYHDADGEFQDYHLIGTQTDADALSNLMDQVEDMDFGITNVEVYKLARHNLDTVAAVLREMHELYDNEIEEWNR